MSQANQHRNPTALAAKERTTQALAEAQMQPAPTQKAIKASDEVRSMLNERLFMSRNRAVELEQILAAFGSELTDEKAVQASVEAALLVLEEYPQKQGAL